MNNSIDEILEKLEKKSFKSYLVGGFIRDKLLGISSYDVDITTQAKPEEILEIFKEYKCIDIGKKYGTIKILYKNQEFEITTLRKESGYSDKRHPEKIEFTYDINEDLKRRDFTINAIAYRDGKYIDPFLGRKDLKTKTIKAVGNPKFRIKEDAIRTLRAVRFSAKLGFDIEKNLKEAIKNQASDILDISHERIKDEINMMLMGENRVFSIKLMQELGILKYIMPEVSEMYGFDQHSKHHNLDLFEHTISVLSLVKKDLTTILAALYHDTGKISTLFIDENGEGRFFGHQEKSNDLLIKRLEILKYPKKTIKDVSFLVRRHMDNTNPYTKKSIRKLLRRIGEENIYRLFDLQKADILSTNNKDISNIEKAEKLLKEVLSDSVPKTIKDINFNGNDLKAMGYKPGKIYSEILNQIEDLILEEKISNEKKQIIKYIKNKYPTID